MIFWYHEHHLLPRPTTFAVAACILWSSLALPASAEDLTIVMKIVAPLSGISTDYISSSMIRNSGPGDDRIYDLVNHKVIAVNHDKKEYWEMTAKEYETNAATSQREQAGSVEHLLAMEDEQQARMAELFALKRDELAKRQADIERLIPERRKARMADLVAPQERLAGMIEKDRAEMEKRKAYARLLAVAPSVSVQKGTGRKKIAGYDCEEHIITTDAGTFRITQELWVAPDLQAPPHLETWEITSPGSKPPTYDEMKDKGFALAGTFTNASKGLEPSRDDSKNNAPPPSASMSWEAVEVKKGPIDASVFRLPDGYTKVESPSDQLAKLRAQRK